MALLVVGLLAYGLLVLRASRTFLLTQRALDLVVVVGLLWLGTALVPALTMNYSQLGWWIGHEVELDGILLVGLAVAVDLARAAQSRPLAGDLRGADLVAAEDVFLGSHVRALTVRLADKDEYTERHTRRVALRAVQVGEKLGLSANRLRTLAIGALVHDIGKLSVPDAILKKPGPLDEAEYAEVQEHPERGYKLLNELGGFTAAVRHLVRDHHERLDGGGYPRGLAAAEIDLDTRILTVCDVYDALISKRVYRAAWSHEDAMALLHRETGTAFDARCVAALEQVVAAEQPSAEVQAPVVRRPVVADIDFTRRRCHCRRHIRREKRRAGHMRLRRFVRPSGRRSTGTLRRLGIALLVLAVATAVVSVGSSSGATPAASATLTATGNGGVTYTPDTASLSFGANAQKATAAGAIAADATAMNSIIDALKTAGASDVSTQGLSLSVRYTKDGTSIVGFQAGNSVQGSVPTSKVGSVIDAAVAAGATNINGPSFSKSGDTESLYRAALRQAVVQARQRAQVLADAAGVHLVRIVSIDPSPNYSTVTATPTAAAAPTTPVLPPTQQVTASVTLVFAVAQ
jgi:HD-GYP domain-containing protein (c-di-GMP phosphodiesterase class II)/uncharacterized protein YggE